MTDARPELLITAPMMPFVMEALEQNYVTHRLWEQADRAEYLHTHGANIRGVATNGGVGLKPEIMAALPTTRVLILSMHTTEDFVRRAIKAGASGYLVKDSAPLELKMAIASVLRDEIYLSPRVSRHVVSGFLNGGSQPRESSMDALTARQREILQLIAEGTSTKEIAFQLNLSIKTVETHRAALMERLDIHDIAGLVIYAVRHGLINVDRPES